jgi:phage shock protein A
MPASIVTLSQFNALQTQVNSQAASIATLKTQASTLQAQVLTLQNQVANLTKPPAAAQAKMHPIASTPVGSKPI